MRDERDVLTPAQLMARLPFKKSRFYELQKQGAFRFLEVKRPIGGARYSAALVEKFVNGESPVAFVLRRAS